MVSQVNQSTERKAKVAALLTCHNRVDLTLACLQALHAQAADASIDLVFYVVDDGSSDGTSAAVSRRFPQAHVIQGDGSLYWNGGMRLAFDTALAAPQSCDFYFWVNDDTTLMAGALRKMIDTELAVEAREGRPAIVVGATVDPVSGATSYSGWRRAGRLGSAALVKLEPGAEPIRCDAFNGNCVLIPERIAREIGSLDRSFTHSMGDLDYGFRAVQAGYSLWLASKHVASCRANAGRGLWTDESAGLWLRWRRMLGPKGIPVREWRTFTRRHSGALWWLYWLNPYFKFWIRGLLRAFIPPRDKTPAASGRS